MALADRPDNAAVLQEWVGRWFPPAREAVAAAAELLLDGDGPRGLGRAEAQTRQWLSEMGLGLP